MKRAIYPGTFNPWHDGHGDILTKALQIFDEVVVLVMSNPDKNAGDLEERRSRVSRIENLYDGVRVDCYDGLLVDVVDGYEADAIIRGLRSGHDLNYESNQLYWYEDLGLDAPIVYFICDRNFVHISSSAIRTIEKFKEGR